MDRIEGKISADGTAYEIRQGDNLLKSTLIDEARADKRHAASIKRNRWEPIRDYIQIAPSEPDEESLA